MHSHNFLGQADECSGAPRLPLQLRKRARVREGAGVEQGHRSEQ